MFAEDDGFTVGPDQDAPADVDETFAALQRRAASQRALEAHVRSLQMKYELLNPSVELLTDIQQQNIDMRLLPKRVSTALPVAPTKAYPASARVKQLVAINTSSFPSAQPALKLPLPLPSPSPAFSSPFTAPVSSPPAVRPVSVQTFASMISSALTIFFTHTGSHHPLDSPLAAQVAAVRACAFLIHNQRNQIV